MTCFQSIPHSSMAPLADRSEPKDTREQLSNNLMEGISGRVLPQQFQLLQVEGQRMFHPLMLLAAEATE